MFKRLLFLLLFISFQFSFAQKEGNIWYFGFNAGLDFNSGVPVPLTDGQQIAEEGSASISNSDGQLLFYTDGITVWNKNHQVMSNGTDLNGHTSTSQGATIIQKPGSSTIFYIFTIDAELGNKGFCYSEVDISLSGGLGAVTVKNILIKQNICEKLAICPHTNGIDYWVVVHGTGSEYFLSYLVTSSGISATPVSSLVGFNIPVSGSSSRGIMKFSQDGTRVATTSSVYPGRIELFDFDNTTGILSNLKNVILGTTSYDNYYGIEFSPDGNLLYCSNISSNELLQFNLNASNISASGVSLYNGLWGNSFGALQLGPDGKIYVVDSTFGNTLSIINSPNTMGLGCDLQYEAIDLGKTIYLGLPTIYSVNNITISYTATPSCSEVEVEFDFDTALPVDSVVWDFGDGATSTALNPTHDYMTSGNYTVTLTITSNSNTFVKQISVEATLLPTPLPVLPAPPQFCIQENKTLADITITGTNIQWYDALTGGNLLPDTTLLVDGTTYYASQTISGCESARIPVAATIQNTFGPIGFAVQYFCDTQALTLADFVVTGTNVVFYDSQFGGSILPMITPLVDDMGYWASQTVNGCESSLRTPFISDIISDLPANDFSKSVCDDLNDGKEKVDLLDYNEDIIPGSSGYSFSYYTDFGSADTEISANEIMDFSDYELQSGGNTIYVRVENSTLCYKVAELQLNLIASPIVTMLDTYGICEGGSKTITADPGFYTYTWSTGELSQSITVTEAGTYSVTVTEFHGDVICGTTKNITVVASNKATITSIETVDWNGDQNMLTVFVDGFGNYEYSLDDVHYQSSKQFTGLANGEYTVYVRDINGCGVAFDDVYLLMYPKFFSPNGDSYNDAWGIKFYKNEPNMIVKIFDRYGKFLKQLTDTDPTWDGTFNGQLQLATDYWFTVTRQNGKEHKGHFSLKR